MWQRWIISVLMAVCIDSASQQNVDVKTPDAVVSESPTIAVLMIGNSHSARHDVPHLLKTLLQQRYPRASIVVERAADSAFLDEHWNNQRTRRLLASRQWTHVILQAQKYSMSGRYHYSTLEAEKWIRAVRDAGATPLLFPEWARRDEADEVDRIYRLHRDIADRATACVVPIGYAWQRTQQLQPDLVLHADDGNHASFAGAWLTALMLLAAIDHQLPTDFPVFSDLPIARPDQRQMYNAVRSTLQQYLPQGC
jgi:hypothetical protein